MPMPGKQMVGGELYRYAFQGQEKDPETGKEAFQLRLWDGRIGRWLSTDPSGQYNSPYLGMGNNPINRADPDGGVDDWYEKLDENGNGTGEIEWFDGSDQIGGYEHLGYYVTFTDAYNNSTFYNGDDLGRYYNRELVEYIKPSYHFKKDNTYDIRIEDKILVDAFGSSLSKTSISYNNEKIGSSYGYSLGFGLGLDTGGFIKYTTNEVTFHQTMTGKTLLDVFNKTGLVNNNGFGAGLLSNHIRGFDSRAHMNLLWEGRQIGSGFAISIFSGNSYVPNFVNLTN